MAKITTVIFILACTVICKADRNIAYGKTASLSQTNSSDAQLAVDGDLETSVEVNAEWRLDLLMPENVSYIFVHIGEDASELRTEDVLVYTSISDDQWENPLMTTKNKSVLKVEPEKGLLRYIKINKTDSNRILSLLEVNVTRQRFTSEENLHMPFKPSFVSNWYPMQSQSDQESTQRIFHSLNKEPIKVIVDVKVIDNGKDYIFHGFGSAQCDSYKNNKYGGILVLYNDKYVLLIAPDARRNIRKGGRIVHIGPPNRWTGPTIKRDYQNAMVRVRVWIPSDFPAPSYFSAWEHVDTKNESTVYRELSHSLHRFPDLVSVQVKFKKGRKTYIFEGQGSSAVTDLQNKRRRSGGVVFGYSNESIRLWFPYKKIKGKTAGNVFASNGWAEHFTVTEGEFRVMAWNFNMPPLISRNLKANSFNNQDPIMLPDAISLSRMIVNIQFEVLSGKNAGFRFNGVGSSMHDGDIYKGGYGGMIYGVTNKTVLIWIPNKTNKTNNKQGYILNIGNMWGNGERSQATNDVLLVSTVFRLFEADDLLCQHSESQFKYSVSISDSKVRSECPSHMIQTAGDRHNTCLRNGNWSGSPLQCEDIKCDFQEEGNNYFVHKLTSTIDSTTVEYRCDSGYRHTEGNLIRNCTVGQWTGQEPTCTEITCPEPYICYQYDGCISHRIGTEEYYFECIYGYEHTGGNLSRICLNGKWSGDDPKCTEITCPPDDILHVPYTEISTSNNAILQKTNDDLVFKLDDEVTYSCNYGYSCFDGDLTRTCQEDRTWSGQAPNCREITCPPDDILHVPYTEISTSNNALLQKTNDDLVFKLDDEVTYSCNYGYSCFDGDLTRTCQEDRTWSGQAPNCREITCPPDDILHVPYTEISTSNNALLQKTNDDLVFKLDDEVTYSCNYGYSCFDGDLTRTCQEDRTWSGQAPNCREITCPPDDILHVPYTEISTSNNALLQKTNNDLVFKLDDEVTYSCNYGYSCFDGDLTRTCQEDRTWSGQAPNCREITCPPDDILHVSYTEISTSNNAILQKTNDDLVFKLDDEVTYSCNYGYSCFDGDLTRTCQEDRTWSGQAPNCREIECPGIDSLKVNNASIIWINDTFKLNAEVRYECSFGFTHSGGNLVRNCQENKTWSGQAPNCTEIECSGIDSLEVNNASIIWINDTFKLNAEVRYECSFGFTHSGGNLVRNCLENKTWSGQAPNCTEIECPGIDSLEVNNASIIWINDTFKLNAEVRYECSFGFTHSGGNLVRNCQENKTWSGQAPNCTVVECPTENLNKSSMLLEYTGNKYMDKATFRCLPNHRQVGGSNYRLCQINSTWSDLSMECYRCKCPCMNESKSGLQKLMTEIKQQLTVDKRKLSLNIRKRTSAQDNRPTAKGIGIIGGVMLTGCLLCIIIPDIPLLYRQWKNAWQNIHGNRCHRRCRV